MLKNIPKKRVEPFLKWAGGKSQLLEQFKPLFPKEVIYKRYIEPFIGGGAVFFYLEPKEAIISDLNKDLIEAYKVVKSHPKELIELLKKYEKKHSKEFYLKIREEYNADKLDKINKAAHLIYLNKACFNGLYRVNSKGGFNVPFGKHKKFSVNETGLLATSKILKNTKIEHTDFTQVLKNAKKGDFVKIQLAGEDLSNKEYSNCVFKSCSFDNCDFSGSIFIDCKFIDCKLSNSILSNCSFQGFSFEKSKLLGISFISIDPLLIDWSFLDCHILICDFSELNIKATKFIGCELKEVDFINTNLMNADFSDSSLNLCKFISSNLSGANFIGASNYFINPMENKLKAAKFSNPEVLSLLAPFEIKIEF